jgi:MinD-like ATPase involved in chromosome partitioning or flagellar assembly
MNAKENKNSGELGSRVIMSMGGKGGVGKTSVMVSLVEWFDNNGIPAQLLDLDTENKSRGSLSHFYGSRAPKINIHTPAGLDAFVDYVSEGSPVIIADMGAGAGQVTADWFDRMYPSVAEAGIVFTAIGVITNDPASVESVLGWVAQLQNRVSYVKPSANQQRVSRRRNWRESSVRDCIRASIAE